MSRREDSTAWKTYGVVMMTSASTRCLSKVEFSPSLSEVVTSSWPFSSSHFLMPSSFSVVPRSCGSCSAWIPPYCGDSFSTEPCGTSSIAKELVAIGAIEYLRSGKDSHRKGPIKLCPVDEQSLLVFWLGKHCILLPAAVELPGTQWYFSHRRRASTLQGERGER